MNALSVGSSIIDHFLTADSAHTPIVENKVLLTLGDKIPTSVKKITLGGNGANVSVGLSKLGTSSYFYTYLGNDALSKHAEETLNSEGVHLFIENNRVESTSFSLIFDFDHDRIVFSHHPNHEYGFSFNQKDAIDFVYLTSIGSKWKDAYKSVLDFTKNTHASLAFSPGSYQLENIDEFFFEVLRNAHSVFINKEEAELILERAGNKESEPKKILTALNQLGPTLVSVTDGANGAYALDTQGSMFHINPLPIEGRIEKTGAGDAYASGFCAAFLEGERVQECMQWGILNAHSVMQKIGAQNGLLMRKEMEEKLTACSVVAKELF